MQTYKLAVARARRRKEQGGLEEAMDVWCDQMTLANALLSLHERVKSRYNVGLMSTCFLAWSVSWAHESGMRERGVDAFNVGYVHGERPMQRGFVAWAAQTAERRRVDGMVVSMQWRREAAKAVASWWHQARGQRLQVSPWLHEFLHLHAKNALPVSRCWQRTRVLC
jgi:hypothetical protein